jgi:hypothetical protein
VLDDAAFGAATEVTPKFISPADPAGAYSCSHVRIGHELKISTLAHLVRCSFES